MSEVYGFTDLTRVAVIGKQTPTVSNGAVYASGDQLGTLLTFTPARLAGRGGRVTSCQIVDKDKQLFAFEFHLWVGTGAPTITSSDNGVADVLDANWDMDNYLGCLAFAAASWNSFNGNAVISTACNIDYTTPITNNAMYGLLVVRGTPTFASTSSIIVGMKGLQD